jgi:hypothetical protein
VPRLLNFGAALCPEVSKPGDGLPGAAAPSPGPHSADEKSDEEHHDADEQQI